MKAIQEIVRANDKSKTISVKAENLLLVLRKQILKNPEHTIFVDHFFLSDITNCRSDQNRNLLAQLADVLDFNYHSYIKFQGEGRAYGYIVKFTEKGAKLFDKKRKYPKKTTVRQVQHLTVIENYL